MINKTKQTEIKYNSYKNNNIFNNVNNSEQSNFNDRNKNKNSFRYKKYILLPNNSQFNMNVIQ